MNIHFNTQQEATKYIRELSVAQPEAIGSDLVWKHDSGAIFIGSAEQLLDTDEQLEGDGSENINDLWRVIGTVAERLL